jgi:hypothetical protein
MSSDLKNFLNDKNLIEKVEYNAKNHYYLPDRTHTYINTMFIWNNTEEGKMFWMNIHKEYKLFITRKQKLERICQ